MFRSFYISLNATSVLNTRPEARPFSPVPRMSDVVAVKRQLIKAREAVKRKLQALKEGVAGQEFLLTKAYEPITRSIQNLKTELTNEIKSEIKREKEPTWAKEDVPITSTPTRTPPPRPKIRRSDAFTNTDVQPSPSFLRLENIGEVDTTTTNTPTISNTERRAERAAEELAYEAAKEAYLQYISSPQFLEYLEEFDPLPRSYIEGVMTDLEGGQFNNEEGHIRMDKVRYDWRTDNFMIGDTIITFTGPNLCIGEEICYKGSVGLYELLFKVNTSYPFSIKQKKDYADILKKTHALYSLRSQRTQPTWGHGMLLDLNDKPIEYVYFDDANELCDRLKLLVASQEAGNTNHRNEITSILEELRECGIIE